MMEIAYAASKWGQEYTALPYDEVLGAGSAGPGKTAVLIAEPFPQIMVEHERMTNPDHPYPIHPGMSTGWCLHLRRTLPMIEQTVVRSQRLYPQLDPGAIWEASKMTWKFSSGYRVQFGHCSEIGDWDRYMSAEYSMILFDELVQFHEEQYDQIITRLRSSDPVLRGMLKVRAMSNPMMKRGANENFSLGDPQWVKRRFVDPAPTGKVVIKKELALQTGEKFFRTRMYYPATLYDNPDKEFVRNYDMQLANAPMHIQQALRYGSWDVTEGSFFGHDWRPDLHVCEPFEIPPHWPMFRSMDWGFKTPGNIHWYAMDDEDNLFVVREMRFEGQTDMEVVKAARQVEKSMELWHDHRSTITGPADTNLWQMTGEKLKSKAQVFQEMGMPWRQADKRSRQRNAELVTKRLRDHRNGTTAPGLVIFSTCRHLIRTLPAMQTSQTNPEEPAKGGDDHAYDCIDGSSLVETPGGEARIAALKHGDLVKSTDGLFYPCVKPRLVREDAETMRVEIGERILFATPNHRVLCTDGVWRRVDQLRTGMYAFAPWTRELSVRPSRSSKGFGITSAASTSRETGSDCIEQFGNVSMSERSRRGTISTIAMTIEATIRSTISNFSRGVSTSSCTPSARITTGFVRLLCRAESWLKNGIEALRAWSGTVSTPSVLLLPVGVNRPPACVPFAQGDSLIGAATGPGGTVRRPATRSSVVGPASTTKSAYALPAGSHSWSTGSSVPPPVHGNAVRIGSVTPAARRDVWCLGVPGMGAFVAEGVVVSNSLSYACAAASHGRAGLGDRRTEDDDYEEVLEERVQRGSYGYGSELC